jgi:L-threonylcarbamoyladenylate synthase
VNAWHLQRAVRRLRQGGLVLHPTVGVWGLACDPQCAAAVADLLRLKDRPVDKGLILVGASSEAFAPELDALPALDRARVQRSWPGPVTWVLPSERFPEWITGGRPTVALRVPGHDGCRALCQAFGGPLVSTSANRSDQPPAGNRWQARAWLSRLRRSGESVLPWWLPGETLGRRSPSDICTLEGRALRRSA